jgi:pimeloyl-ACP methyl ester carboxylesterase
MAKPTNFVFLHGGGQGGWVWDETIAAIKAQSGGEVRCLALDGPGCGAKRGRNTAEMDFAGITAGLVADVRASDMQDAVLVGHSQAGTHMPAMIEAAPELFRQSVFVSCIAPDPGLTTIEMTRDRIHDGSHPFNNPDLCERDRYRAMFCNDMAKAQAEEFLDRLAGC